MKGLELARAYYEAFGAPMLSERFADVAPRIACGLVGDGSECYGFDDELSQDHDFGPGFFLWLTDRDMEAFGGQLSDAYAGLPGFYAGFAKKKAFSHDGQRAGVMRISDFYYRYIRCKSAPASLNDWRKIPEPYLAAATNGEVFCDPLGEFSAIRKTLLGFYPEDVRLRKIIARAAIMAQAGQYNYPRCLQRGEEVAAGWALNEFTRAACSMAYLLNKKYMPFYKWSHRGMRELPVFSEAHSILARLSSPYTNERKKQELVEAYCAGVVRALHQQGLTKRTDNWLLAHCPDIQDNICDPVIREMHVMAE